MTLPRFRLRTLMVLVAIVGVVMAAEVTRQRMARLSAAYHAQFDYWCDRWIVAIGNVRNAERHVKDDLRPDPKYQKLAEARRRECDYCRAMMMKYIEAAQQPWRPVAPDPPEPK